MSCRAPQPAPKDAIKPPPPPPPPPKRKVRDIEGEMACTFLISSIAVILILIFMM